MKKIIFYIEKYRLIILLIIIIIILLVLLVLNKDKYNYTNDIVVNESSNEEKIVSTIKVDIKGMVENSGVYEINDDSRVIDQTTPNMIQRISGIFERNSLISKEI